MDSRVCYTQRMGTRQLIKDIVVCANVSVSVCKLVCTCVQVAT